MKSKHQLSNQSLLNHSKNRIDTFQSKKSLNLNFIDSAVKLGSGQLALNELM